MSIVYLLLFFFKYVIELKNKNLICFKSLKMELNFVIVGNTRTKFVFETKNLKISIENSSVFIKFQTGIYIKFLN